MSSTFQVKIIFNALYEQMKTSKFVRTNVMSFIQIYDFLPFSHRFSE